MPAWAGRGDRGSPLHCLGCGLASCAHVRAGTCVSHYTAQALLAIDWHRLLQLDFVLILQLPHEVLQHLGLRTILAHEDHSEGRLIAGLVNACMLLGRFPRARKPATLRVAAHLILWVRGCVTGWMSPYRCTRGQMGGRRSCSSCATHPPVQEVFSRSYDFYWAVSQRPSRPWTTVFHAVALLLTYPWT